MEKYVLIVTEKPDAAQRIAFALDSRGRPERMREGGVPYYVARRDREIVVVPALGHLYTVGAERSGRNYYPVFRFKWVPRHVTEKNATWIRKWLQTISKLAENADAFVDACDYDLEGSIIGYTILKYTCGGKEATAKRMRYSTLTKEELEKSYLELLPHLDFGLIEAGLARHEIDWLYGINLSRALTLAAKERSGQYATLSTGRVQGPTLKFLVAREKSIRSFVPAPYWTISAQVEIDGRIFEAQYEKETVETKEEADAIVDTCKKKRARAERIETRRFTQPPLAPFDLGALQGEAYRLFRYTPTRTSKIAQKLYLDALISYPRTNSQKLPPAINYGAILRSLNRTSEYRRLTAELLKKPKPKPNEGVGEDSAHPAVYPTGNLPERALDNSERSIWDLVVRRFMAVLGEPALKQSVKVTINIEGYRFYFGGSQTLKEGWLQFYRPFMKSTEVPLPAIEVGQSLTVKKVVADDKFTKPSARYNPNSLRKRMETSEIGTKATRADIIQTLYDRKYVHDDSISVTDLGFEVSEVLDKYCPAVASIKLTRELEARMNAIQQKKEQRESVVGEVVGFLKPVLAELKEKEKAIGEQLSSAVRKSKLEEKIIGTCPICHTGQLTLLHSRKTGKRFAGCTNYFKGLCKASFPLPQRGSVKPMRRNCHKCGWPTVLIGKKGRHLWKLCLNPQCPLKAGRKSQIEVQSV